MYQRWRLLMQLSGELTSTLTLKSEGQALSARKLNTTSQGHL